MLIILVIRLRGRPLFLRSFSPDQDLALGLFLKPLLIVTLGADQEADVVDTWVLWDVNLFLDF